MFNNSQLISDQPRTKPWLVSASRERPAPDANGVSDTAWIASYGRFDADGRGGKNPRWRLFSMDVPAAAVTLAGDFNHNGVVDAADYVVWRKNDGTPATTPGVPTLEPRSVSAAVWRYSPPSRCQPPFPSRRL